uniref:Ubiquitinyl hydrolase 1 n=1 Tax=Trichobilharzia regenti TaxID=157069 RepID=A0AA85KHC6_TRIRE|nr:unnamed protein product [Trichobilharzia regenti]
MKLESLGVKGHCTLDTGWILDGAGFCGRRLYLRFRGSMTDNCKHVLKVKTSIQLGILSPEHWHCSSCYTTESVWACLSCSNFACGRYISEHALQHFKQTNWAFEKKRGRRILRHRGHDVEKNHLRLMKADDIQTAVVRHRISRLSWALHLWWSRYAESKMNLGAPSLKGFISSRSSGGLNGGQCLKSPHERGRQPPPTSLIDPQTSPTPSPSLYEEVRNLFKLLWSGQKSIVSPTNLLNTVWSTLPNFKGYKQQDAQEFLSLLLDRLQTEVQGIPMAVPNNSCDFINRAFRGYSVSHVRCSTCQVIACTEEPIYELSLSLPTECYSDESCKCDVVDLLRQFVSPSDIDGASYACVKCNQCYAEVIKKGIESTRSTFNEYIYDPSDQPYPVDKMVSIVLSRLASPPHSPRSSHPDFSTSCDLTETSSISESMLSNASSLTCIEEQCINPSVERSSHFLTPQSSTVNSPRKLALPTTKNSFLTHATQTIRLSKLPRVLRLHIKRFRWVGRQREKLTCHVSFPLILNMTEFMLSDDNRKECGQSHLHDKLHRTISQRIQEQMGSTESTQAHSLSSSNFAKEEYLKSSPQYLYHLTGVVVHHGRGFQSGHYTAYCLNDEPECWLHCNDANVSLCDFSEVAAAQAYLLFYSELMPRTPLPNWCKRHTVSESLSNTIPCSTSQPDIPNIHSVYSSSSENYEKASKMCSPGC